MPFLFYVSFFVLETDFKLNIVEKIQVKIKINIK